MPNRLRNGPPRTIAADNIGPCARLSDSDTPEAIDFRPLTKSHTPERRRHDLSLENLLQHQESSQ
jgi:hypothetical protein